MKKARKILTFCLAVLMFISVVSTSVSSANAYTINGKTVRYTDFSSSPDDCWNYANNIYNKIWGQRFSNSFSDNNNSLRNLSDNQLLLNTTNLKNYVSHAALGSCLRVCNAEYLHGTDGWGHSQIIVQKDSNGFTVFEGGLTASPHKREKYYTWSEYCSTGWLGGTYKYIKYIKWPGASAYTSDTQKPVISNVKIVDNNSTGYTVTCTATDNVGVTRVAFPTWTHHKGQDDIVWKDGNKSGNTFSIRINKSEHNGESDWYATHIYAYDAAGNVSNCIAKDILVPPDGKIAEATYNGNRYIVYKGKVTHQYAVDLCESYGGHLAAITSAGENSVVANLVAKVGTCWIDGSDAEKEGVWKFSDGTKMTYFNWQEGEPNSYMGTDQDYLAMVPRGEWDDTHTFPDPGSGDGGFVCEIEHTHSYSSKITKQPTCTSTGVKTFTCSCGKSYTESIAKTSHNSNTTIPAVAPTCRETGLTEGKKCSVCGTVTVAQQTVAVKSHKDDNSDYKCDYGCGYEFEKSEAENPSTNCSCNCHKGGIVGFFFKLINFFEKIFGINKVCACGVAHY